MTTHKPLLGFFSLWNISFGFFGIQVGLGLQNANASRIFQTLGTSIDDLPILWIAAPLTGLLVQPVIGYMSDRTWGRFGRRRPYFLAGAIFASLALVAMPNSPTLWVAAGLLWILDASINVSMEPFRAFVGDMLDERQRTKGYAFQAVFIGTGAVAASLTPYLLNNSLGVSNTAAGAAIPPSVKYSFYAGAAVFIAAVLWTVVTTREYSPEQLAQYGEDSKQLPPRAGAAPSAKRGLTWCGAGALLVALIVGLGLDKPLYILGFGLVAFGLAIAWNSRAVTLGRTERMLNHILSDLHDMPGVMRRLALVQFLSWFALFIMWIYATPIVAGHHFGATDPASKAYNEGADWVGVLFGIYNGVAALYAFLLPRLAQAVGLGRLHMINLFAGGVGFASFYFIRDPNWLMASMVAIGMAWASILTIPYSILSAALPQAKLGIYMGLFNIFIVLPQIIASTIMGALAASLYPEAQVTSFLVAGIFMIAAGAVASQAGRA